jgi:hypothetical protein
LEIILVQLIKKGGLRERANRSRRYAKSENNIKTLDPHRYQTQEHLGENPTKHVDDEKTTSQNNENQ